VLLSIPSQVNALQPAVVSCSPCNTDIASRNTITRFESSRQRPGTCVARTCFRSSVRGVLIYTLIAPHRLESYNQDNCPASDMYSAGILRSSYRSYAGILYRERRSGTAASTPVSGTRQIFCINKTFFGRSGSRYGTVKVGSLSRSVHFISTSCTECGSCSTPKFWQHE
jgi:hypothetical protein